VSTTERDLALVEAHFDSLPVGSAWCGYGTCDLDGEQRLVIFVDSDGQRAMTLTRCADASFEIADETGAMRVESSLEDFLTGLARLSLLDG
jgi:hypothetical protein